MEAQVTDAVVAPATATLRRPQRVQRASRLRSLIPYLFLSPAIVLFLLSFVLPLGYAVWQSLFRLQRDGLGLGAPKQVFTGLSNYQHAFSDPVVYQGLGRVLLYGVLQVPVMLGLALLLALLLDSAVIRLRAFFRIAFFLPHIIPGVVGALLWAFLYNPQFSPVPQALAALHLGVVNFQNPNLVLLLIGNIAVWAGTGYQVLILFSSLQAVPTSLYEASRLDGCSEWQIAWFIKVPLIFPALVLTGVLAIIGALQLLMEPLLLQTVLNGITSNFTPNMYMYQTATGGGNYYYAAALSVALALVTGIFSFSVLRLVRRKAGV